MKQQEIFEYCLHQLLDRYREKAMKEAAQKELGQPVDESDGWSLEDVTASDFTRQMVRLGVISFPNAVKEGET